MKGILGRKLGMTEVFTKDGKLIPVTVIEIQPNTVMQVKTVEKDGYKSVQLGLIDKKENRANKASLGHAKKANTAPKRFLKEIRNFEGEYNLGDQIKADIFTIGEIVDVTGTSKGKGFQGVIKRHNQSRGPMGHGSHYHRGPGSMGTMLPKRVLKGKKLPGHMGMETTTIQNLEIIDINLNDNYILVSGNIPGPKKSLVLVKSAIKKELRKVNPKELINYDETVVDEIEPVEEVVEEIETENEEANENAIAEEQTAEPENKEESASDVNEETTEEVKQEEPQKEGEV